MRKITTMVAIAAALLFAAPAQAQFSWGIKGGVNLGGNDLTKMANKESALDMSNYSGFFIGPKAEIRIPIIGIGVEASVGKLKNHIRIFYRIKIAVGYCNILCCGNSAYLSRKLLSSVGGKNNLTLGIIRGEKLTRIVDTKSAEKAVAVCIKHITCSF